MFTRSMLRIGKARGATLVESYIAANGAKAYQVHDSLVVFARRWRALDHVRLIETAPRLLTFRHPSHAGVRTPTSNTFGMTSGRGQPLSGPMIAFCRRGLAVETNGVNLLNGRQHADTTLFLDHACRTAPA